MLSLIFFIGGSQVAFANEGVDEEIGVQAVPSGLKYPGTNVTVKAGDVLYSSKGKNTNLVGHIGIVDDNGSVVHMMTGGMKRQSVANFAKEFTFSVYTPRSTTVGKDAGKQARTMYNNYVSSATYTLATGLHGARTKQYCTKTVWQAYYYGANRNLGGHPLTKVSLPPWQIVDTAYLTHAVSGVKN